MHVVILPILPGGGAHLLLDRRIDASFSLYRATVREGLRRLRLYRESRAYHAALHLPRGTKREQQVRAEALHAAQEAAGLTEQAVKQWAACARKTSVWIAQHISAVSANWLGGNAWESLARHLFEGAGRPVLPTRAGFSTVGSPGRNSSDGKWQAITVRGRYLDPSERAASEHRGRWDCYDGPLVLVWNPAPGKSRELIVPLRLANPTSTRGRREHHALADPSCWRCASV